MAYALGVWASWIAWHDWRRHRIANASLILVLAPALLSWVLQRQGLLGGAVSEGLWGLGVAALVTFPGYMAGVLGAGDVKYAATLGLILGWGATLKMLLLFALLLGAASAVMLWRHRGEPALLKRRMAAAPALTAGFLVQLFGPLLQGALV